MKFVLLNRFVSMNLVIDIGNTLTKLFVFKDNQIVYSINYETNNDLNIDGFFVKYNQINQAIISSVADIAVKLLNAIQNKVQKLIILDHLTKLPIKNLYQTPETLGKDRIAAIVGANNIFPNENVLAIDAGTALTFDFINQKAEYLGGNISPGLNMRYKALNYFTKKLPLIEKNEHFSLIGKNTQDAIIAGVQNGILFEINSYIDKFTEEFHGLKVILTGGDTFFFAHKLKCPIFAEPFLVAIGLNRILQNNVEEI